MIRVRPRPGISPSQCCAASSTAATTAGAAAITVTPVLLDPTQDLGAVDLADHDLGHAQPGHRERHPPAVGVEHRQRVEVDVAVAHAGVQPERHRIDPDVAVGDLHALGPGGGAGGVVDARGGVLVRLPVLRLGAFGREQVVVVAEDEAELRLDVRQRVVELGIDQQHPGPGVLDDVGHLVGPEPEVDRHQDPPGPGHAEERREQSGAVVADDRDPVADADAELVELRGLPSGPARRSRRR